MSTKTRSNHLWSSKSVGKIRVVGEETNEERIIGERINGKKIIGEEINGY